MGSAARPGDSAAARRHRGSPLSVLDAGWPRDWVFCRRQAEDDRFGKRRVARPWRTRRLAEVARGTSDGVIVFAPAGVGVLMRVMATGGTPVPVTQLPPGAGSHRFPQFLPDGRHFLFLGGTGRGVSRTCTLGRSTVASRNAYSQQTSVAVYAPPASLLWVEEGVLVAQRFDPARAVVSGEPIPVVHDVGLDEGVYRGAFAVSATGVLAHRAGQGERRQLTWVDRAGVARGTVGPPDEAGLSGAELAPDGKRVAVMRTVQGNTDVWLIDTGRDGCSRFTFNPGLDGSPVWSSDGTRVVFSSSRNGPSDLFEKAASGAGDDRPLLASAEPKMPLDWSSDGQWLLYTTRHPKTGLDLWAVPMAGDRKPVPVMDDPLRRDGRAILPRRAVAGVSVERIQASADLRPAVSGARRPVAGDRRRAGASRDGGPTGKNCSMSGSTAA